MARLICVADGNNTSSSTWALVDSTSYTESETNSIGVPTSYSTGYTQFTPGAITIDGIAIRIASRSGTTGTFSVDLYNHTAGASVAGTEVTVDCADIVDANTSPANNGGWMFFKFGASTTLIAANAYTVRVKTSTASQVNVYGSGASSPCKMLRTTTTQAPTTGDDRFVMGEWTAAGATTTRTVTLDDTSTVDYGSASTSLVTPALSISAGGIVLAGTTAATTYIQKISGNVVVYSGGILRIATSGSRMPSDSSFTWTFDCVSNVDFGITARKGGECTGYGKDKLRFTTLSADEAAAQTVISLTSTTNWADGDELLFTSTTTSTSQTETKTITTVDSSTQVTLSAGLTHTHTGSGDLFGEVGNLTNNITIRGTSSSVGTFITFAADSIGILDNVTVQYYGSSSSGKRGVEATHITTSSNSVLLNNCVFRSPSHSSSTVGNVTTNGSLFTITNCIVTNTSTVGTLITIVGTTASVFDVSDNLVAYGNTGIAITATTSASAIISGNKVASCSTGLSLSTTYAADTSVDITDHLIHACTNGVFMATGTPKSFTNCDFVSNSTGITTVSGKIVLESCNFFGNLSTAITGTVSASAIPIAMIVNNSSFRGRSTNGQPSAFAATSIYQTTNYIEFNNCDFGQTIAHTTADVNFSQIQGGRYVFNNCTFASTTEFSANIQNFLDAESYIGVQRKDGTTGNHITYIKYGIITPDTTIYNTSSPSLRVTPTSATVAACTKLFPFRVYINSGEACTPSLYVRESVVGDGTDYNGNRIKLYVKANYNLGVTADTLLDTATVSSVGAWEQLTGTTSTVTDDGVLEFYVTCDGTTGWINIDDFTFTNA